MIAAELIPETDFPTNLVSALANLTTAHRELLSAVALLVADMQGLRARIEKLEAK